MTPWPGKLVRAPQRSNEPPSVESADWDPTSNLDGHAADDPNPAPNHAPRFIWDTRFALASLDFLFIGFALLVFLNASYGRLDFSVSAEAPFILAAGILANLMLIYASGGYTREALLDRQFTASRLPIALGLAGATLFAFLHYGLWMVFPTDLLYRSIGRSAIISFVTIGLSLGAALSARAVFYAMVRRGVFHRRILIVGTGKRAQQLHANFGRHFHRSQLIFAPGSVVGAASENHLSEATVITSGNEPLEKIARNLSVDEVVVALDETPTTVLARLLACKTRGIRVTDVQSLIERETGRVDLGSLESSWLFCSDCFGLGRIDLSIKRLLDILLSLVLLFIALPVLVGAIVAIGIEGHGQIIFRQRRVTQNGRTFWLYKLRTMFADAERSGPRWAEANDPRITAVGRILRKFRIDEIPQLLNVLKGDMSLVGPRPERPVFVEQLSREIPLYDLRHTVKAGLTGWAQINYRYGASAADAKRKLEYDLHYVKHYRFLLDISIIVQTFRVLIWGDGAR